MRLTSRIAIDMGTANTVVSTPERGIVLEMPSVTAYWKADGKVESMGDEAKAKIGRTPDGIRLSEYVRNGVIGDFGSAEKVLTKAIRTAQNGRAGITGKLWALLNTVRPTELAIGIPAETSMVEHNAMREAAEKAGIPYHRIHIVLQPMAAAVGAGIDVAKNRGNMVVDIGGGTTDIIIVSGASVFGRKTLDLAGNQLTEDIVAHLKKANKYIGFATAEELKKELGSAVPLEKALEMQAHGKNFAEEAIEFNVTDTDIREAMKETLKKIAEATRSVLEHALPEIAGDVKRNGIWLAGGGALIRGMDKLINQYTNVPVHITEDPLHVIVKGLQKLLANKKLLQKIKALENNEIRIN